MLRVCASGDSTHEGKRLLEACRGRHCRFQSAAGVRSTSQCRTFSLEWTGRRPHRAAASPHTGSKRLGFAVAERGWSNDVICGLFLRVVQWPEARAASWGDSAPSLPSRPRGILLATCVLFRHLPGSPNRAGLRLAESVGRPDFISIPSRLQSMAPWTSLGGTTAASPDSPA